MTGPRLFTMYAAYHIMKKLLLGTCTCIGLSLFTMTPAFADWAAIAYCRNTGRAGMAWQRSYASTARDSAISECSRYGERCIIEMLFENQCGALARNRSNISIIAAGYSNNSRREAGNNALASCGNNCELVTTICSNADN